MEYHHSSSALGLWRQHSACAVESDSCLLNIYQPVHPYTLLLRLRLQYTERRQGRYWTTGWLYAFRWKPEPHSFCGSVLSDWCRGPRASPKGELCAKEVHRAGVWFVARLLIKAPGVWMESSVIMQFHGPWWSLTYVCALEPALKHWLRSDAYCMPSSVRISWGWNWV